MSAYTGWVNDILDQYKTITKGVDNLLKEKHSYTPKQLALIELNRKLVRLGTKSVKFKLPLDAMLFDVAPNATIEDTIKTFIDDELMTKNSSLAGNERIFAVVILADTSQA